MTEVLILIPQIATALTAGAADIASVMLQPPFNIFLGIALIGIGWNMVKGFLGK